MKNSLPFCILLLLFKLSCSFTSFLACTGVGKYYDYTNQSCLTCPINTVETTSQIYCNCSVSTGYYPNPSSIGFSDALSCSLGSIVKYIFNLSPRQIKS